MARKSESLDYSNIFEAVEFPDAYKVSYLANAIVFPTYEDVRKDFGLVRAEYHLLLCLAHYSELTAQDVARITRRPRNSISRAVHRMLDLGFLKRVPDPDDALIEVFPTLTVLPNLPPRSTAPDPDVIVKVS